jgi:hypothetical protein
VMRIDSHPVVPANEPVKKSSRFPANCDSMEMLAERVFEGS